MMKRLGLFSLGLMAIGLITFSLVSCSSDPMPNPTVNFIAAADGYEVTITVEATNATTFAWDYGDGNTSAETGNHTHTYTQSGEYPIVVTVTNESGTATKTVNVTIAASMTELLTGVTEMGKTWILDAEATTKVQKIATDFPLWNGLGAEALNAFALETEYDNQYFFLPNGGYMIAGQNGAVLAGIVYSTVMGLETVVAPNSNAAGLLGAAFTDVADGGFTLHENETLTLTVANENYDLGDGSTDGPVDVTFENANFLTFTEGSHLGILDFTTTVLIREISADQMVVTFFLSSLNPETYPDYFTLPSIAITTTLKVLPN